MIFEKSAGAVVFRERDASGQRLVISNREYLLLARKARSAKKDPRLAGGQAGFGKIPDLKSSDPGSRSGTLKEKIVWDFPKGLIDGQDSERKTAEREVAEETGLTELSFVDGFHESIRVLYKWEGEFHTKTIIFFLARTTSDEVKISFEHAAFEWLDFDQAFERLSFKGAKEVLKKAEDFLNLPVVNFQSPLDL